MDDNARQGYSGSGPLASFGGYYDTLHGKLETCRGLNLVAMEVLCGDMKGV